MRSDLAAIRRGTFELPSGGGAGLSCQKTTYLIPELKRCV